MVLKFTINPTAPYDAEKLMNRLRSHNELIVIEDEKIVRTLRVVGQTTPVLMRARFTGTIEAPQWAIHILSDEPLDNSKKEALQQQAERMFTAHMDMTSFYQKMSADPVMSRVVQRHYGLRLFTDANLFESMVRTIIGQQLNVAFAATLTKRFVSEGAPPLIVDGKEYLVFPTPEETVQIPVERLRELQFSTRKAEYVIDFARAIVEGKVDLDRLYTMSDEEIMEDLIRFRGIGRWTVECLLLFGIARPNLLPAADIGLRNAIRNEYGLDHQPTEQEVREIGSGWEPFRSYATYYLWETLADNKAKTN